MTSFGRTYKNQFLFVSRVTCFWRDPSCQIKTPASLFYEEVYEQKWCQKGLRIVLEESHEEYLQVSFQGYSALMWRHEHTPQEPRRTIWLQERDAGCSAPTHSRHIHIHCAPRQLGTTANQRYDIPWDWLWNTCLLARLHWGTHGKGFCSKEGLHYRIRQSGRNPLVCDQMQRGLGNHLEEGIGQAAINLYSQVWKFLEDSLPELYCIT
jgi:hypothetical protein